MTKEEFIKEVTAGLTPPPQYFAENARMNKSGYTSFDEVLERGAVALSPQQFEDMAASQEALILDVRSKTDFAKAHIPGSIFIGIDGSFAPWVGALMTDLQQPIVVVAPEGREEEVVTRLARVGYDHTLGYLEGRMETWIAEGKSTVAVSSISAKQFSEKLKAEKVNHVLDVRKPTEFLSEHLKGAVNFPLDFINQNMDKIQPSETYHLYCRSGYRSMVAASILKARGFSNVIDVAGGWKALSEADIPKTDFVCPTIMSQEAVDAAVSALL